MHYHTLPCSCRTANPTVTLCNRYSSQAQQEQRKNGITKHNTCRTMHRPVTASSHVYYNRLLAPLQAGNCQQKTYAVQIKNPRSPWLLCITQQLGSCNT
jgi:hypothetical protein